MGSAFLNAVGTSAVACQSLREAMTLGAIILLLVCATGSVAQAEESTVQQSANRYAGKLAKQFPPNRTTTCPSKCKAAQEDLNAGWQELDRFDKDHPEIRAVYNAWNAERAAKQALADAKKAGTGVAEAQAALTKAQQDAKAAEKKHNATGNAWQKEADKLDELIKKLEKLGAALEACEKNCPKEGPVGAALPEIPKCFDQKFVDDLNEKIDKYNSELGGAKGLKSQLNDMEESDPNYATIKAKVEEIEANVKKLKEHRKKAYEKWQKPCPYGMYFPGKPHDGQVFAVTVFDSGQVCTFGPSEPIDTPLTPTDINFNPLPEDVENAADKPTEKLKTPTPTADLAKPPTRERPRTVDEPTPDQPKTPGQPNTPAEPKIPEQPTTTTEKPSEPPKKLQDTPTTQTPEATPTDDIVILFKGNQEVIERGQTGEPLQGQHVMLMFQAPKLRESGTGKPATDDSGYDKDGVQAVTGGDGQATMRVKAADRGAYLAHLGDQPKKYYRIDAVASKNTGRVSEITHAAKADLVGGAPQTGNVSAEVFRIGNRVFVRRLYVVPYDSKVDDADDEERDDWCRVVEPGPPLGLEGKYPRGDALAGATVKLRDPMQVKRAP